MIRAEHERERVCWWWGRCSVQRKSVVGANQRTGGRAARCLRGISKLDAVCGVSVRAPGNTVGGRLRSWAGGSHRITSHLALPRPRPRPGRVEFTRLSDWLAGWAGWRARADRRSLKRIDRTIALSGLHPLTHAVARRQHLLTPSLHCSSSLFTHYPSPLPTFVLAVISGTSRLRPPAVHSNARASFRSPSDKLQPDAHFVSLSCPPSARSVILAHHILRRPAGFQHLCTSHQRTSRPSVLAAHRASRSAACLSNLNHSVSQHS